MYRFSTESEVRINYSMLNSFLSFQTRVTCKNFVTFECFLKKFLDTVALSTHEFKRELLDCQRIMLKWGGGGGKKGEWSNLASHSGGVVMLNCFMPSVNCMWLDGLLGFSAPVCLLDTA